MTTLTYVYADSTAVLGPLAVYAEPHSYDLCSEHAERMTAPRGWEIIRLAPEEETEAASPSHDDLEALADAVREAAQSREESDRRSGSHTAASSGSASPGSASPGSASSGSASSGSASSGSTQRGKRGHLRVLRDPDS